MSNRITKKNEKKLKVFLRYLNSRIDLRDQGLLRSEELIEIKKKAENLFFEIFLYDQDNIIFRKFRKLMITFDWAFGADPRPESGGFLSLQGAEILFKLKEILEDSIAVDARSEFVGESLILKGEHFSARKILHSIFNSASKKIVIMDSYLDGIILEILEDTVAATPSLEVFLLTTDKALSKFNTLASDLVAFKNEYPDANIQLRNNRSIPHDRFILIDESDAFQCGHSIDGLGKSTSRISKIGKKEDVEKLNINFKSFWSDGT